MRPFSKWAGEQIEEVCRRNDIPRHGHETKGAWETERVENLHAKIIMESNEFIDALKNFYREPSEKNRQDVQWEAADLAGVIMMLSARLDPVMSKLDRGKTKHES